MCDEERVNTPTVDQISLMTIKDYLQFSWDYVGGESDRYEKLNETSLNLPLVKLMERFKLYFLRRIG